MSMKAAQANSDANTNTDDGAGAAADSIHYFSSGFMQFSKPQVLDIRDIWAAYQRGSLTEKDLLAALAKRVEELNAATVAPKSTAVVIRMLEQCQCHDKSDTADAIEAFLNWADYHAVTVFDVENEANVA